VNASLVFGGQPGPSARNILWILYRKVKASRWMLGSLTLAENSLASDGESHPHCPLPHASSPAHREHGVGFLEGSTSSLTLKQVVAGEGAPGASQMPTCGSAGSSLTDLALETIRICFTSMRPFLPQTFLPGSEPFVLLEKQILQLVRWPSACFWGLKCSPCLP
jgi:hypothetical protein